MLDLGYPIHAPGTVADLDALRALTVRPSAVRTLCRSTPGDQGGGEWVFQTGDQSANVTADTGGWVAPNSDPTGASGAWERQYDGVPVFSILNYGAVADGDGQGGGTATFDAALVAALDAADAASGGIVVVPATGTGIYVMSSAGVTGTWSNVALVIEDGVQIDTTLRVGGGYSFRNTGSEGSSVLLTAQAVRGDDTLTVASTAGLTKGDWLRIRSTIDCLSDEVRAGVWEAADVLEWQLGEPTSGGANVRFGEFVQIKSVDSATQLTLASQLMFPKYPIVPVPLAGTVACSSVAKINFVENFHIKGGGQFTRYQSGQVPGGITYKGGWNAATNTPALVAGVGTTGDYYYVTVGGIAIGETWTAGETALFDGVDWVIAEEDGTNVVRVIYGKNCTVSSRFNLSYMVGSAVVIDDCMDTTVRATTIRPSDLDVDLYDHSGYNAIEVTGSTRTHVILDATNDSQTFDETYRDEGVPCIGTKYEGRSNGARHVSGTSHGASYGLTVGPLISTNSRAAFFCRARFFTIDRVTALQSPPNSVGIIELGPWATDGAITNCFIDGAVYGLEVNRSGFEDGPVAKNLLIDGNVFLRCQFGAILKSAVNTPETAAMANVIISNNSFKECEDYGVFADEYTNGVVFLGNNFGTMTGTSPVAIFADDNCINLNIFNNTGFDIGASSTLLDVDGVTDTVTFPALTYRTSRLRMGNNQVIGDPTTIGTLSAISNSVYINFVGDAAYTLTAEDVNAPFVEATRNSAQTFTLSTTTAAAVGDKIVISQDGTGPLTLACSGVTINGSSSSIVLPGINTSTTLIKRGSTSWAMPIVATPHANTFTSAQIIEATDNTNPALRVTQLGTGDVVRFEDSTNPDTTPFVITSAGVVLINAQTAQTFVGSATWRLQVNGTSQAGSSIVCGNWDNATTGGLAIFAKSKSGTIGTHTVLADGDDIGTVYFEGSDGTAFIPAARIRVEVDGTPGTNDMPTRIVFATTLDGAATTTDRWQIGNAGMLRCLNGSFGRLPPVTKTADFTVATNENWLINNKAGSTCTVTLPSAASFPGREIMITNYQAQTVVSASSNVVPIAGGAAGTAILSGTAGRWATLVSDGTNWIILQGVI
jgi:hypothetical protein